MDVPLHRGCNVGKAAPVPLHTPPAFHFLLQPTHLCQPGNWAIAKMIVNTLQMYLHHRDRSTRSLLTSSRVHVDLSQGHNDGSPLVIFLIFPSNQHLACHFFENGFIVFGKKPLPVASLSLWKEGCDPFVTFGLPLLIGVTCHFSLHRFAKP